MTDHQEINLAEFISVLVYLTEQCGSIIRDVQKTGFTAKEKGDASPVTQADIRVQKTLETVLQSLYPSLDVRGEESKESMEDTVPKITAADVTAEHKRFIQTADLNACQEKRKDFIARMLTVYKADEISAAPFETFNTKDAIVWIDPLDGTSDFVKNNLPACTVLVGLAIKGYSRLGVVHQPFSDADESKGKTYYATAEHGVWELDCDEKQSAQDALNRSPKLLQPYENDEVTAETDIKIAVSLQHFSETMKTVQEKIMPSSYAKIGGAGNKCNNVALGTVNSYVHPSPGLKHWDLCAPESVIKAMGGWATDLKNERLTYHADQDVNLKGLVLGKTPNLHAAVIERLGDLRGQLYDKVFNKPKEAPKPKEEPKPEAVKEESKEETTKNEQATPAEKQQESESSGYGKYALGLIALGAIAGAVFLVNKHK